MPATIEEMDECLNNGDCTVFQSLDNKDGHSTTDTDRWLVTQPEEDAYNIECFKSVRYEPYVVARWCGGGGGGAPYYDERFFGYGKNKIQHVSHLRHLGYTFAVLPGAYLVHFPHPESSAKSEWHGTTKEGHHRNMDVLYKDFNKKLKDALGWTPLVRTCDSNNMFQAHN
jgi:hypothetical protein